jgi:hypothetical protein
MAATFPFRSNFMNKRRLALVLVLISGFAYGQAGGPTTGIHTGIHAAGDPPEPVTILTPAQHQLSWVKGLMTFTSPLKGVDFALGMLGDEAAANILMILGDAPSLSGAQMQTAMDIVHNSFLHPYAIEDVANRKPTASLALLRKLQATAVDQLVKERIAAETTFLNAMPQTLPPQTLPGNWTPGPNPFPPGPGPGTN